MSDEPTITVSVSRKVNMERILSDPRFKYESADYFVSISGIKAGMTAEEMAPLLDTGRVAWDVVRAALVEQIKKGGAG